MPYHQRKKTEEKNCYNKLLNVGEFVYCIRNYKLKITDYKGTYFLNELTGDTTLFEKGKYYKIIEYEEGKISENKKYWRIQFAENPYPDTKPEKSIRFRFEIMSKYFCCTLKEYRKLKLNKLNEKRR